MPTNEWKPGPWSYVVVGCCALCLISGIVAVLFPSEPRPPAPARPEAAAEPEPEPEKEKLPLGMKRISGNDWIGCIHRSDYEKLAGYSAQGDREAFRKVFAAGLLINVVTTFKDGEIVCLEKATIFAGMIRVRRQGETVEYWTAIEAVK